MDKKNFLQPLRITSGWEITINNFFDEEATEKMAHFFDSSIVIAGKHDATKEEFVVESKYDNADTRFYVLTVRKSRFDKNEGLVFTQVVYTKKTTLRKELIDAIENYMLYGYKLNN